MEKSGNLIYYFLSVHMYVMDTHTYTEQACAYEGGWIMVFKLSVGGIGPLMVYTHTHTQSLLMFLEST